MSIEEEQTAYILEHDDALQKLIGKLQESTDPITEGVTAEELSAWHVLHVLQDNQNNVWGAADEEKFDPTIAGMCVAWALPIVSQNVLFSEPEVRLKTLLANTPVTISDFTTIYDESSDFIETLDARYPSLGNVYLYLVYGFKPQTGEE